MKFGCGGPLRAAGLRRRHDVVFVAAYSAVENVGLSRARGPEWRFRGASARNDTDVVQHTSVFDLLHVGDDVGPHNFRCR